MNMDYFVEPSRQFDVENDGAVPSHHASEIGRSVLNRARLGAKIALVGIAFAQAEAPAQAAEPVPQPSIETYNQINQLPGYAMKVNPDMRAKLKQATVKIYTQPLVSDYEYGNPKDLDHRIGYGTCTGIKIAIQKNSYISSAAHCVNEATQASNGLLNKSLFSDKPALDFYKNSFFRYNFGDASEYVGRRHPLATAYGMSVSTENDRVLFKVAPVTSPDSQSVLKRQYHDVKALRPQADASQLVPGQEVALYGAPQFNLDKPISATGRFLGRTTMSYVLPPETMAANPNSLPVQSPTYDVIAINPKNPYTDPCEHGGSGLSFVATTKDNKMVVSDGLSGRINTTYDQYLEDYAEGGAKNDKQKFIKNIQSASKLKSQLSFQLKVDTDAQSTLCLFGVNPLHSQAKTLLNLKAAFGDYAPVAEEPSYDDTGTVDGGGKG